MKKTLIKTLTVLCLSVLFCMPAYASEHTAHGDGMAEKETHQTTAGNSMGENHDKMDMTDDNHIHKEPTQAETAKIGITEKLGEYVAKDAVFKDSKGRTVTIDQLVDKPTIFAPVYYSCPNVCNFLQTSLADVIPQIKLKPGIDFQVISISFDETDTPETAARKKVNYMKAADGAIPEEGWIFLTGDRENILKLTESLGFRFMRRGKDFAHAVAVMAVSPTGKIVRYLYGTDPMPFELTMASVEAAKEQTGLSVKKLVSYCFSYDPEGKKYVFNVMRVSGFVVLTIIVILAAFLFFGGKKRK